MKLVVLSARTVIDGVIRERGEWVVVPDEWNEVVKRVVAHMNVREIESRRKSEIIAIEKEKKEREKPKDPKGEPPIDPKLKDDKGNGNGKVK